ncbi:MAG: nucleoside recognition domain-containing protein [Bacteroidota bacterium]
MNRSFQSLYEFLASLLKDVYRTILVLFKIMIPVSIMVKILQMLGFISVIGHLLYPIMKFVGLPGEMGLVWASGMITNLFGGVIAFLNISGGMNLSIAQVTTISIMMLVAHTFPIELQIARKTGVRLIAMFCIRFGFGFLFGLIIFYLFKTFGWYTETAQIVWKPSTMHDDTLASWVISELKNYGIIVCFIFCLMLLLRILKKIGVIEIITRGLNPFLKLLGIGKDVTTIALVGLTLGVVYGGALIIDEAKNNPQISRKDIFYAMALMGLCHSVIEDTVLMVSLGATLVGVFVIRLLLSILVIFCLVRITRFMSEKWVYRIFLRRGKV